MKKGIVVTACDNSGGSRVGVMDTGATVVVQDATGAQVRYDYGEWDQFIAGAKAGTFDRE